MNTFDTSLIYGFLLGCTASATLALGLWLAREEGRSTILPVSDDDTAFRPTREEFKVRVIPVCETCHRYTGCDRRLHSGQHVALFHDLCPHCAKRRASKANPEPAKS